jgi:hypothetical protein
MRIGNIVRVRVRVCRRLITYMQTDDLHVEFAPLANNSESAVDLYDNVPVVEIMARERMKKLAEAAISAAASTSAATRGKKGYSASNCKL